MKRIIALWLAALMLAAQPVQAAVCVGFGQSAAPYLFRETFDATGYDNSTAGDWTETGTPDEDCTTVPCPLTGSGQSFSADFGQAAKTKVIAFTNGKGSVEGLVHFESLDNPGDTTFVALYNGTTQLGEITVRAAGTIKMYHGAVSSTSSSTLSAATTYHYWVEYEPNSGATDGKLRFYLAPYTGSETKPTEFLTGITAGTATGALNSAKIIQSNSDTTGQIYFDNFEANEL